MSKRYIFLTITAILSSCAVTVQYSVPVQIAVSPSHGDTASLTNTKTEINNSPTAVIKPLVDNVKKPNDEKERTSTKKTLCSAFISPTIPVKPKVDLSKLNAIAADDHESVKNLLIDNIQALNDYSRKIEEDLKIAIVIHKKSCGIHEVINKK